MDNAFFLPQTEKTVWPEHDDIPLPPLTGTFISHWNRLPGKVAERPSLVVFKRCVDVELKGMI